MAQLGGFFSCDSVLVKGYLLCFNNHLAKGKSAMYDIGISRLNSLFVKWVCDHLTIALTLRSYWHSELFRSNLYILSILCAKYEHPTSNK